MVLSYSATFALKKWNYEPSEISPEVFQNMNSFSTEYCVQTKNRKGYAFSILDESVDIWASSLAESKFPLLDLGAGYGFQTIAALKKGRNVIAVDMETEHLKALQDRVLLESENVQKDGKGSIGHLVGTKTATLPKETLFAENEVAGILLSEVIHFCSPGEPLLIFKNAYKWLQPGGLFVVTGASPVIAEFLVQLGATLNGNRSINEAWNILSTEKDDVIIKSAATLVDLSKVRSELIRDAVGSHMYCISTNELSALARSAGFEVERADYIPGDKYPMKCSKYDSEVLLVARKPAV